MVEDTPDDLVFELHNEALWGPHPYGYSILGTRDTVNALGVAGAAGAARARVPSRAASSSPRRATSSTITLLDVLARTGLDGRAARRRDAARVAAADAARRRRRRHVARDGAQTHIVAGTHGRCRTAIRGGFRCCCSARCSAAA